MPLTTDEREFLDAYVYEVTNGPPFGGPATRELSERGIRYSDLSWILTAYQRTLSAEGKPSTGVQKVPSLSSPWENKQAIAKRNAELRSELAPEQEVATEPGHCVSPRS
jgi:hypothetical protein